MEYTRVISMLVDNASGVLSRGFRVIQPQGI